jgi:hypothetical protein
MKICSAHNSDCPYLVCCGRTSSLLLSVQPTGHDVQVLKIHIFCYRYRMGRGSVGCISTCHELDGPGIESWWRWDLPHPSRPSLVSTQLPVRWIPSLFTGAWRLPPTPPNADFSAARVPVYLHSLSGPTWLFLRRVADTEHCYKVSHSRKILSHTRLW